jgi:hypothetical protein
MLLVHMLEACHVLRLLRSVVPTIVTRLSSTGFSWLDEFTVSTRCTGKIHDDSSGRHVVHTFFRHLLGSRASWDRSLMRS